MRSHIRTLRYPLLLAAQHSLKPSRERRVHHPQCEPSSFTWIMDSQWPIIPTEPSRLWHDAGNPNGAPKPKVALCLPHGVCGSVHAGITRHKEGTWPAEEQQGCHSQEAMPGSHGWLWGYQSWIMIRMQSSLRSSTAQNCSEPADGQGMLLRVESFQWEAGCFHPAVLESWNPVPSPGREK